MAEIILLVAQVSSSLTVLIGIISLIFTMNAAKGLADDSFKSFVRRMSIFLFVSLIGILSMTAYHIADSFGGLEITSTIWYIFMFIAIAYSIYDSYKILKFEKPIYSIKSVKAKKR